jgi:cell division protein FtsN
MAQAGIYSSWEEVLSAREAANIAGFGSISKQLEDGTYTLSYVFKGTKATASSQLERLNEVLGEELKLFVPIAKSLPIETATISGNKDEGKKQGIAINVSANFEKIPLEPTTPNSASVSEQKLDVDVSTPTNPTVTQLSDDQPDPQLGSELQEQTEELTLDLKAESETVTETDNNQVLSSTQAVAFKDPKSSDKETKQDDENVAEEEKSGLASKPTESIISKSNSDPLYAIIFGSFKSKRNAIRKRDALIKEGHNATIFDHDTYYRVGIEYQDYPSQPLRNFKKQGMQCWLLRND